MAYDSEKEDSQMVEKIIAEVNAQEKGAAEGAEGEAQADGASVAVEALIEATTPKFSLPETFGLQKVVCDYGRVYFVISADTKFPTRVITRAEYHAIRDCGEFALTDEVKAKGDNCTVKACFYQKGVTA